MLTCCSFVWPELCPVAQSIGCNPFAPKCTQTRKHEATCISMGYGPWSSQILCRCIMVASSVALHQDHRVWVWRWTTHGCGWFCSTFLFKQVAFEPQKRRTAPRVRDFVPTGACGPRVCACGRRNGDKRPLTSCGA